MEAAQDIFAPSKVAPDSFALTEAVQDLLARMKAARDIFALTVAGQY